MEIYDAPGAAFVTLNSTTIIGGADTRVLFDDGGKIGENAGLTFTKASGLLASTLMAIGGATIGTNALAVTGTAVFNTPIAASSVASMTATVGGGVPTPPNNTTTFLRGDGTFAAPSASGVATAYINWSGGGTTINRQFGPTMTITRNGTGDYTINGTFPANAVWIYGQYDSSATSITMFSATTAPSTSVVRLKSISFAGTAADATTYWAAVF